MKNKALLAYFSVTLLSVSISLAQAPNLGTASSFALFTANGAFSNTGASTVTGDIGTALGAFSGFPPGTVSGQTRLPGSSEANQAATDVMNAYNSLGPLTCATTILAELGGQTLAPGVYCQPTADATSLNGTLTLSGAGVYVIKLNSALTTATNSTILLTNGASACNVFFQVNGAATLGTGSVFKGTILATGAIALGTQASLEGRGLSTAGAISLNTNVVTVTNSSLSINVAASSCVPATNQYSISGIISSTSSSAATVTLTDGTVSATVAVGAGDTSTPYSLTGLVSGTGSHTVVVSCAGSSGNATYVAPASCTTSSASLGGTVYADNNGNGVSDGGDTPIASVTATLLNGANTPIASTATNASGLYSFTGLTPGIPYSVSFTTPAGFSATTPTTSGPVTLAAGENNTGLSAGFKPASGSGSPMLAVSVTPGATQAATNQYTLTGVISLTGATAGSLTVTDGATTTTVSVTAGQTSATFSLTGLPSGSGSHTVSVSGAGYTPATITYMAPVSVTPSLSVQTFVSASNAVPGDVLTYSVVLTNSGSTTATTTVRDSLSAGGTYIPNSAIPPAGTSFTPGQPISTWNVPIIGAGQSLTLTFQASVDASGILYNVVTIPGDTAKICTSIPVKLCLGDEYTLTVPAGRGSYRWYRNGILIPNQTTNELVVSQAGSYSLGLENANGSCPDFSCCPFIVEEDALPSYQAVASGATCVDNNPQNNGQLVLSNFVPGHTYQYSLGTAFNITASLSGLPKTIPVNGVISTTLPNSAVSQSYTVRVYNASGCYVDQTVTIPPTLCTCPADVCVPFTLTRTKRH
ncbi:ice-binding family protein [Spirosoma luteum]|uniref:ice-binding family protein n=1 Tax=Spirosoma luteum TaxID=431553 RepID=UPI00037A7733|nr:ice-binding family protein [Spirosoma luteum]